MKHDEDLAVPKTSFTGTIYGMAAGGAGQHSKLFQITASNGTDARTFLVIANLGDDVPGTAEGKMIVAAAAFAKDRPVKITSDVERGGLAVIADIQFPPV